MSYLKKMRRTVSVIIISVFMSIFLVTPDLAIANPAKKSDLQGYWVITLTGRTGCGLSSMYVYVELDNAGIGKATIITHGECNNYSYSEGQTFRIVDLDPSGNGAGAANLSCGVGCGWNFLIQVSPDGNIFNIVNTSDRNNFLGGVAVRGGKQEGPN